MKEIGTSVQQRCPQEIAQKAIDYLAEHSSSHFAVTFYGGEPLANFPLVRWATEYTLEHYKDKHPTFNLTTNLTLVTDEIADFWQEHRVLVLWSAWTVQKKSKMQPVFIPPTKPTFADAMRGLNTLSKAFIKHGKSLTINSVLYPALHFMKNSNELIASSNRLTLPPLTQCMITYPSPGTFPVEKRCRTDVWKPPPTNSALPLNPLLKWQFEKAKQNGLSWEHTQNIYFNTMLKMMETIDGRMVTDAPDDLYHCNGCCVPGSRKLYVKANGDLLICERIGSSPIIGNILPASTKHCFPKSTTQNMLHVRFRRVKLLIVNLCPICYANCYTEDGIDPAEKASNCNGVRSQLERCF